MHKKLDANILSVQQKLENNVNDALDEIARLTYFSVKDSEEDSRDSIKLEKDNVNDKDKAEQKRKCC